MRRTEADRRSHGAAGYHGSSPVSLLSPGSTRPSTEDQIASIMMRLGEVERRLDIVREPPTQGSGTSASPADNATVPSLLVPAAQGRFRVWGGLADAATTPSGDAAVYDDRHETEHDVMEFLCLRRDLSRSDDPPFGIWWTYTIEETLLWPILMFEGNINRSLDIVMLGGPDDTDSESGDSDPSEAEDIVVDVDGRMQDSPTFAGDTSMDDRRGLDDGTIVPGLIDSFLKNVHIKCPFLDPPKLQAQAARLVENGVGWDAGSCKVVSTTGFFFLRLEPPEAYQMDSFWPVLWGPSPTPGTAATSTTMPGGSHRQSAIPWRKSTSWPARSASGRCMHHRH